MKKLIVIIYDKELFKKASFQQIMKKFQDENSIIAIYTTQTLPYMKEIIACWDFAYDYLIVARGAAIFDYHHNVIIEYHIHPNVAKRIHRDLQMFTSVINFQIFCTTIDHTEYEDNIIKLIALLSNSTEFAEITRFFSNKYRNHIHCYTVNHKTIEMIPKNASLNSTLYTLSKKEHILQSDIYVMGDIPTTIIPNNQYFNIQKPTQEDTTPQIKFHKIKDIEEISI